MELNRNIAISESGFIFNPLTGDSFSSNPVGQDIIRLLKEEKDKDAIIKELHKKYGVERTVIEKDLYDFFLMLRNFQLLKEDE
ncbi:MAG: PqqD family protein [Bacteroidia bacterium]